jgi:hypothetical protein
MNRTILVATLIFLSAFPRLLCADFKVEGLGFQFGIDAENEATLNSYELVVPVETPWEWSLGESAELELYFEGTIGAIHGEGTTSGLLHFGLLGEIEMDAVPFSFIISSGPTLITEENLGGYDLGNNLEFTSSIGVKAELASWTLGYRFQHISNGGLGKTNPGLDMHVFSAIFEF